MDYLRQKSGLADLEEAVKRGEEALSHSGADDPDHEKLLKDYENAVARFNAKDGYAFAAQAKQILAGFGFRNSDFQKNCGDFSGGWKMRIMLAVILLSRPDIMLLDEPTNHLDTESLEWLESWLKDYPGTILTIAHDRVFLDKIVTVIAELANRTITIYKGNYSYYLAREGAAPRGPEKGDGAPAGGDQADQGVRRAVPLQGHEGQPGPEPDQDAGEVRRPPGGGAGEKP